ncbi:hypothetical protein C8R43DRAFT_1127510 [Mycena crocata]|nr:hypothetical protein C8R43DRAFT_1127510 [Mycena crocata]
MLRLSTTHLPGLESLAVSLLRLALALALQRYSTFYFKDYNLTSRRFTQDPNRNPEVSLLALPSIPAPKAYAGSSDASFSCCIFNTDLTHTNPVLEGHVRDF